MSQNQSSPQKSRFYIIFMAVNVWKPNNSRLLDQKLWYYVYFLVKIHSFYAFSHVDIPKNISKYNSSVKILTPLYDSFYAYLPGKFYRYDLRYELIRYNCKIIVGFSLLTSSNSSYSQVCSKIFLEYKGLIESCERK